MWDDRFLLIIHQPSVFRLIVNRLPLNPASDLHVNKLIFKVCLQFCSFLINQDVQIDASHHVTTACKPSFHQKRGRKVISFHDLTFIEQNTKDDSSENKCNANVWPAGVTVLTVKRFEAHGLLQCFSLVTGFPPSGRKKKTLRLCSLVSGNLYHRLDPCRVPLSSTKTKHWPQIRWKTRKHPWRMRWRESVMVNVRHDSFLCHQQSSMCAGETPTNTYSETKCCKKTTLLGITEDI